MGAEQKKGPRELLDLDVREVSLVDRPAIRREFLVLKRLEEEQMGAFDAPKTEVKKAAGDEKKPGEMDEMMKKMPEHLRAAMEGMKKAVTGKGEELEKAVGGLFDVFAKAAADGKNPFAAPKSDEVEVTEAKKKAEEADAAAAKAAVAKSENPLELIVNSAGEVVIRKGAAVPQKASEEMGEALTKMLALFKAIDPTGFAAFVQKANLPADPNFSTQVRPSGADGKKIPMGSESPITKSEGGDLATQVVELTKRLESIEKARGGAKGDEPGGGTDGKAPVQKGKSMWGNIL